nr:hypothetical protein [Paraburkholderia sp. SG-MS1]
MPKHGGQKVSQTASNISIENDAVVLSRQRPAVAQFELDPAAEPCLVRSRLRKFELRRRDRRAVQVDALSRRVQRKTAPVAAGFENPHARRQNLAYR